MGSACCFVVKVEFENTWPDVLTKKIADLATVERVEQSPYTVSYGSKTVETEGLSESFALAHGTMLCVKYESGFFVVFGWRRDEEEYILVRMLNNQTTNKKKHKEILERIIEIFEGMAYELVPPPQKTTWLNFIRVNGAMIFLLFCFLGFLFLNALKYFGII